MPVLGRIFYWCVGNSGSRRVSTRKVVPVEVLTQCFLISYRRMNAGSMFNEFSTFLRCDAAYFGAAWLQI